MRARDHETENPYSRDRLIRTVDGAWIEAGVGPEPDALPVLGSTNVPERVPVAPADVVGTVQVGLRLPAIILHADARTHGRVSRRFLEFFTATIRNPNTRMAYARAIGQFFAWCEERGITDLPAIEPIVVAAYVEDLGKRRSKPTVKQHIAAIRMLFDWLVTGQVLPNNPAGSVRGPKHVVKRGKTPVLSPDEARELLDSIDVSGKRRLAGLRDRAILAVMVYTFARVSAVVALRVEDYYPEGKRWWIRLHEKGGKRHEIPAHHKLEEYLDAYLEAAGIADDLASPLFRSVDHSGQLTETPLTRTDGLRMVKRRARRASLPPRVSCHTFRATGITAYLSNGGTLEHAQRLAAHESPKTTKLYDRTSDQISLDEIERILI